MESNDINARFYEDLRHLIAQSAFTPDSPQDVIARYILAHGFAALSETQLQQFCTELLPMLEELGVEAPHQIEATLPEETAATSARAEDQAPSLPGDTGGKP
ncbi:hypothetical protein KW851_25350 [Pseudomonas sp. PDM33]|uniref:hypothetical protein n=1 Tax=unclassified Pseudomonas TaxID=196821 RepID=UPI00069A75A7|nr:MULTISPECIES: hypothetical protein [unclassified Pseudomonas]MBV7586180.1 hypothetical protein [Pseudomonas sp. PDM33]